MLAEVVIIFLSYSRADKALAKTVAAEIRQAGCAVWMDEQIRSGDKWTLDVAAAIDSATKVLVIVSPTSLNSKWVLKELVYADEADKPIVPLLSEPGMKSRGALALLVAGLQRARLGTLGEDVGCKPETK